MAAFDENLAVLTARLGAPPLAVLPYAPGPPDAADLARYAPVLRTLVLLGAAPDRTASGARR